MSITPKNEIILGAYQADKLVGILHLIPKGKQCKLRQMAIDNAFQGQGIGKSLIEHAQFVACSTGFDIIILHARKEAIGFYEKCGFECIGTPFTEVGIPHIKMQKTVVSFCQK